MSFIIDPYRYAAGAAPFDPSSYLAGLNWYLNADTITGNDGDAIVDWFDGSGAGAHYGQNTTLRQPTLKTNRFNGHSSVLFGTNKCLVEDPTGRSFGAANTLICVCTPSGAAEYILKGTNGEGGPAFISKFNPGGGVKDFEYFYASGGHERKPFAASASGLHILTVARTDDTGNYKLYYDGVQVEDNPVVGGSDWNGLRIINIGAFTAGSSAYSGEVTMCLNYNQNHAGAAGLTNLHAAIKSYYAIA